MFTKEIGTVMNFGQGKLLTILSQMVMNWGSIRVISKDIRDMEKALIDQGNNYTKVISKMISLLEMATLQVKMLSRAGHFQEIL